MRPRIRSTIPRQTRGLNGSSTVGQDDLAVIMSTRFAIMSCNVPRISPVSDRSKQEAVGGDVGGGSHCAHVSKELLAEQ